jgi:hypothetical protein
LPRPPFGLIRFRPVHLFRLEPPRDLGFYPPAALQRSKTRSTLTAIFKVTIDVPL